MPVLSWLDRDEHLSAARRAPYRLLEEAPELGAGDKSCGNMLVQGDNLDGLKALLPFYAGRVKCVYIDPPYNTRSAFEHYDDNLEHSRWLAMMWPRLELLRELLAEDGSIWVSIDDNEGHYLKVIMDEIFGRKNFVANVIWRKNYAPKSSARHFSEDHDHVLISAKSADAWVPKPMPRTEKQDKAYKNPDNDPRGLWRPNNLAARNFYSKGTYPIECPSGRTIPGPPHGSYWRVSEEKFKAMDKEGRIWWGKDGGNVPAPKIYLSEVKNGIVPQTFWNYDEVGHTQLAKKENVKLFGSEVFGTPKPESLIQRILHIATNPGDLVLDSFLGSGTTAAVALKMGRRFIGIEMGEHAVTHCAPRLQKVIAGEQGGISEAVGWQGGGGFGFYRLGRPAFDAHGAIDSNIRFPTLAAHVWFSETGAPFSGKPNSAKSPLIGVHGEGEKARAIALLYNGILGDKTPKGGNVLNRGTLAVISEKLTRKHPDFEGQLIVYGEATSFGDDTLKRGDILFKQTPYDVKARR
jgi:adenine-specific DNA-methyltransferase